MSVTSRSQETNRIGQRPQSADTGTQGKDHRPQSPDRGRQPGNTVRLLYHGSCSRCHHFHRHVAFDVPIDCSEHTRFHCERCQHSIFGLGRTDTQNSLASQDSFPMKDGSIDFASTLVPCSNRSESSKSLQLNTSTHLRAHPDPLSAILENSLTSPGQSIPSASASIPAPSPLSPSFLTEPRPARTEPQIGEMREDSQSLCRLVQGMELRPALMWRWIRKLVRKLASLIDEDPHELTFLGLRLHYQLTTEGVTEQPVPGLAMGPHSDEELLGSTSTQQSAREASTGLEIATLSAEPVEEASDSLSCAQQNRIETDPLLRTLTSEDWSNRQLALRKERLRIERREKTLKTRALQRKCDCTEECHCKRQESEPSFVDSTKRSDINTTLGGSPRTLQWLPPSQLGDFVRRAGTSSESNHSQVGARPDPLTCVGESHCRRWETSNSTMSSGSRRDSGQSASNLSNTNSVLLHPRRPIFPGRSLSASLLPFSTSSRGYDFGTGEVFRSLEFVHHARAVAAGSSFLPWHRSVGFPRTLPHGVATELDEDPMTAHRPSPGALFTNVVHHLAGQENLSLMDRLRPSSPG